MKSISVYVSVIAGLMSGALLTSCGDDAPSTNPAYYTPGGYWTGSVNGEPGVGLSDESGDFAFIAFDGELYPGSLMITAPDAEPQTPYGALFSGSMQHITAGKFPNYGVGKCPPPDFTDSLLSGVISGTIVPRASISGTATFTCVAGMVNAGISLTFNGLYYLPSSLATISGTYKDLATGTVLTINTDGTVFAQDATTGCVINGTVSIINPSYNVYGIEVSYANCTGSLTTLNGATLAGFAALDNTNSPEQLLAGVWSSGPPILSVTYTLARLPN